MINKFDAIPSEWVTITAKDGTVLKARYHQIKKGAPLHIQFHGYRGSSSRDFCGGAMLAQSRGHNTLVVEQRAHGKSGGHTVTFGIKEKYDCVDWVRFVIGIFGEDVKILLGGVSMGAATVLMAAGLDELPHQVKAITADCGYSSPEAIIRKVCRDRGIPDAVGYPFLRLGARLYGGFSLKDGGAVDAVKRAKVPIMIMHGDADDFVPYSMAEELFAACVGEKYLLTIPRAGHGLAYFYDTERYTNEVAAFKQRAFE